MDGFLSFLSDLILLTAGLGVIVFWLVLFIAIAVEIHDGFTEKKDPDDFGGEG